MACCKLPQKKRTVRASVFRRELHTACSDPEHTLSHDAEMRASTLNNDHMKKTKNVYMKC
jgi:hypothetical protein